MVVFTGLFLPREKKKKTFRKQPGKIFDGQQIIHIMEVLLGGIACLLGEFQNLFCYNFKQLAFPCQKFCSDQWFYLLPVTVATSWQWSCDLSALHSFCYYYSLHVAVSTPCRLWLEFTLTRLPYGDIQSCHATTDQQHVAYVVLLNFLISRYALH